jgi:tRNA (cmo5U34)-methyltransferase
MDAFSDVQALARYVDSRARLVPAFADLQKMVRLLIAERAPDDARVLVVGAGGGLEIRAFAEAHAAWTFDGVDPSAEMLDLARATLGGFADRACLHHGLIDVAPVGPFHAATCLLTFHFIEPAERRRTLDEIRRRLAPGAPFAAAHLSFPQDVASRERWLARYAAFAVASGVEPAKAESGRAAVGERLAILAPEDDEHLLQAAGFDDVTLFYVGFGFRGWVAYA